MVLELLVAALVAPGLLGSQEAIRQGQSKDKREEHRARRCNLIATCVKSSSRSREIDGRPVVLRNGKLWIDTTTEDGEPFGHMYAGYYLPYPDANHEGLVTTITDVAPIMNWVYIDRETHEVKYGVRADAQRNLTGPFSCTRQDRRLTFDDWEGWCAVEEYEGYWCLYFDVDDDGLKSKLASGIRVLAIELSRKEKRFKKETEARQQDQKTKRAVDASEDAPVDRPLEPETEIKRPGVSSARPPEPEPVSMESTMLKTPPPAYSKTLRPMASPHAQDSRQGAIDALDNFLAMEARAAGATPTLNTRPATRAALPLSGLSWTSPLSQRRIAPKLNRNSGSKTLAQAQMFEAIAAAQSQDGDVQVKRGLENEQLSITSSNVNFACVPPGEGQRLDRELRPHSSVSQRTYCQTPLALPPVSAVRSNQLQAEEGTIEVQQPNLLPPSEDALPTDSAVLSAYDSMDKKRRNQASLTSQLKRNPRIFIARRPGIRVTPRISPRLSLTDAMSSAAGTKQSLATTQHTRLRASSKTVHRTQRGRKSTSTLLGDLNNLLSQEIAPGVPESN